MNSKDVKKYLEKSGDSELCTDNLISNEHGFMSWTTDTNKLILINVFGDGKYWDLFSIELAKQLKLKSILFATRRNPKGFEKKFNYKKIGYILEKEV